ncbi:MAG: GNAT family N-acetyltransferase [Sulfolobales archaeon]|nr:N-acetyltransferase [Sulfolobales archaeon]MCX8208484.1 N-acetyltransferase [Sulfolobales archaeon]MDW8010037.1 GNAT family N-acetyltransferase [Sulfolobales archaeon]
MEVKKAGGVFYVRLDDGSKAYVATEIESGVIKILETYVPEQHRGRGYAKALVEKVVEYARSGNLKILPVCSYAISYFMKNRELRELLADSVRNLSDEEWRRLYEERIREEARKRS